jgi:hypothetical protein
MVIFHSFLYVYQRVHLTTGPVAAVAPAARRVAPATPLGPSAAPWRRQDTQPRRRRPRRGGWERTVPAVEEDPAPGNEWREIYIKLNICM